MKKISLILVFGCLVLVNSCAKNIDSTTATDTSTPTTTTTATGTTYTNIVYAATSSAEKMDIYLPSGSGPFPVVVLIHGGAFLMGDKSDEAADAAVLVANGYAAVSVNYRLSGEAQFPAQIQDCKAAVRFLRANSTKYKLNPDKIASWGGSAGGNLSALLGTSGGISELEGAELGNSTFSSKVLASVDWFGPINFLTMDAEASALGFTISTNAANSPESLMMGAAVQTIPTQVAKANPTTYITSDDAAFFIQVGDLDRNIPYTQSKNFYNALVTVKGSSTVSFELIAGAAHGGSLFTTTANYAKVISFLNSYLK
ncbi:MAG: alpha/beta hydrolase [Bacteroidetes bacterium]|nr:alpha/beta hydrolase [Bacteroidota bacterium]